MANLIAVASSTGEIGICDAKTGKFTQKTTVKELSCLSPRPLNLCGERVCHDKAIRHFFLNWDDKELITCDDEEVKFWDIREGGLEPLYGRSEKIGGSGHKVTCFDYAPDQRLLVCGNDQLTGRKAPITCVAISPSRTWICVGNKSGNLFHVKKHRLNIMHTEERGRKNTSGVVECIFPEDNLWEGGPLVIFDKSSGPYNPVKKECLWRNKVLGGDSDQRVWSCTISGSHAYFGLAYGKILEFSFAEGTHLKPTNKEFEKFGNGEIICMDSTAIVASPCGSAGKRSTFTGSRSEGGKRRRKA